jgi:hypothetical protein
MSRALDLLLRDAATSTFEDVVFLLAEPLPAGDAPRSALVDAAVSVAFRGPLAGSLWLGVGGGVLPVIAANMLGEDTAPAEGEQLDALGEIANMICGTLLPLLVPGEEFAQLPPQVHAAAPVAGTDASRAGAPAAVPAAAARLGLGRGSASVLLFLDPAA